MGSHVIVYKDKAGEWRWQRRAGNNEIVSTSGEGYVNREHALNMAYRLNSDCEVAIVENDLEELQ
jgi:uncharacterized protein YegP (UPF0339 family)